MAKAVEVDVKLSVNSDTEEITRAGLRLFDSSLSDVERVEWDLLVSHNVPELRAKRMIEGARDRAAQERAMEDIEAAYRKAVAEHFDPIVADGRETMLWAQERHAVVMHPTTWEKLEHYPRLVHPHIVENEAVPPGVFVFVEIESRIPGEALRRCESCLLAIPDGTPIYRTPDDVYLCGACAAGEPGD